MKCSNCYNYINNIKQCNLCQDILCSEECFFSHNQIYHQTNIEEAHVDNSINNNSFLNYAKEIDDISSPFLVKGIMNYGYILYDPMYSPDNFTLIYSDGIPKIIGNGSFGQVFLAVNSIDQKIYAIKHMEKEKLIKYLNCLDPIYAEIDIQSRVNHQNIVKLLYVRENEVTFDLVMEYAKNGTLFDYVVKNKGLSEKLAFKFFIQIVNAIKFLHDNDVIHRDIKPENILLFDNNVAKLCDFGWSIKCVDRLPGGSFTGTTEYMAPELINNMEYGKEIDIWMLGILLYELIHGFSPFRPKKAKFEDKEVVHNILTHNINFYMPVSDDCKELIFSLLEIDVNKRCTIDDIFNSKFVKNFEKEENDYSSHYDKEENEKSDRNNSDSITNSNVNNNEAQHENDSMQITKSQLLNRYKENDELNDSKRIISSGKNYKFINIKRIDSDNLSNSKISQTENSNINNNKNIVDNSLDIDDPYEEEPNAPKNNKRNRLKNKQNVNSSITKLNFNFINGNALSPVKKKEEENKNNISNSPKNNDKKKNNLENELNFDLNPNTIINNNLLTSRRDKEKDRDKELFEIGEGQTKRKRSVVLVNNNMNNSLIKNEITNCIFNNNKEINNKEKILGKKLTLNSNHQLLSLSLSPGTPQYTSLLTRSVSPDKPIIHSKDKNDHLMNQNSNNNFPVDESDNWSNSSQNIREYPFDHLVSNSSLNIRKPIIKNKGNKYINVESESEEEIMIKEKEPNDNMRRKNRNKKEEMPRDNIKKSKLNKNINPKNNNKKGENLINNDTKNKNKTNYETNTVNSALNEPICLNVLNGVNPITDSIIKKINENNIKSKTTSIRNLSVSTTKNLRSKRKKSDNFEKFFEKKEKNEKDKINKKQINRYLNNGNHNNINLKNDIKVDLSPKKEKLPMNSGKHEKPKPLKKIENKNMSFVGKNKNQVILRNNNANKDKEKKQKVTDAKRERKGGSVNKQYINYSKFNKNMNAQKEKKAIKSYRFINEENKLSEQNESVSGNNMNRNKEIIKKDENDNKQKIKNDINKEKEIKENINIKINENKEKNKSEKDIEIIKQEEKKEENKTQKIKAKEEKKNINKKEEIEKIKNEKEKAEDNNSEEYELIVEKEENNEVKIKEVEKLEDVAKKEIKIVKEKD